LIGHWKKRNPQALETNPANLDRDLLIDLVKKYGSDTLVGKLDQIAPGVGLLMGRPEQLDDFGVWHRKRRIFVISSCRARWLCDVGDFMGV
jgi:hypothetical protein